MSLPEWKMPEWRSSRDREVYVDYTGKIVGEVRRLLQGDYYASNRSGALGNYYDEASAKKAVENAA